MKEQVDPLPMRVPKKLEDSPEGPQPRRGIDAAAAVNQAVDCLR